MPQNSRILNIFGFCPSFCGLTPLKLKKIDKKFKISTNTSKFAHYSSRECVINPSHCHTLKIENFNFFLEFCISFRGLTPLKLKKIDKKILNFHQHFKIWTLFIMRKYYLSLPSSYLKTIELFYLFDFVLHFVG